MIARARFGLNCSQTFLFTVFCSTITGQVITTVAGGGPKNLPRLQVGFDHPSGVAVDAGGNLYVCSIYTNQIWKVDATGTVNIFAGTGLAADNGDFGSAAAASLYAPTALAFDSAGNLYVTTKTLVRKISVAGVVSTIAGNGSSNSSGDGGPATSAGLSQPAGIAFDSANNLYIAEFGGNRIRRVTPTGVITTFAGTGVVGFSGDGGVPTNATMFGPTGVAADSAGNIYFADQNNHRVRKVSGGIVSTFAGTGTSGYSGDGGPANAAKLGTVNAVTVDRFNNIFITEPYVIRLISAGGTTISTFAGTGAQGYSGDGGAAISAAFNGAAAIAADNTAAFRYYVADTQNNRIRVVTASGIATFAGNGTYDESSSTTATAIPIEQPYGIAVNDAGTVYFTDGVSSTIRKLIPGAGTVSSVGSATANYYLSAIVSVGNALYFLLDNQIWKSVAGSFTVIGNTSDAFGFSGDGGLATDAHFKAPIGLAVAANGDV